MVNEEVVTAVFMKRLISGLKMKTTMKKTEEEEDEKVNDEVRRRRKNKWWDYK